MSIINVIADLVAIKRIAMSLKFIHLLLNTSV